MPVDIDTKENMVFEAKHAYLQAVVDKQLPEDVLMLANVLANELNEKFMTGLGNFICQSGADSDCDEKSEFRLIFVGGSHASRMASAADRLGFDTVNLATPGFRVTEEAVENCCMMLQDVIYDENVRSIVIYQLLDNNVFFEGKEDGSRLLPIRDPDDGMYHIRGRLEYADHGVIKCLVNAITPLLRAGGDCEKIVLSPLPRYMRKCCKDKAHLVNKKEATYASDMGEALAEMRDSMKDLIFGKKIRNFKVLSTTKLFMEDEEAAADKLREFWKDDAVHMTGAGYEELVTAITNVISSAKFNRPYVGGGRGRASLAATGRGQIRKRQQWVCEDDTLAHRTYNEGRGGYKKFRGNGGQGPRGHGGRGRGGGKWRGPMRGHFHGRGKKY
jgi:hypothetical protein